MQRHLKDHRLAEKSVLSILHLVHRYWHQNFPTSVNLAHPKSRQQKSLLDKLQAQKYPEYYGCRLGLRSNHLRLAQSLRQSHMTNHHNHYLPQLHKQHQGYSERQIHRLNHIDSETGCYRFDWKRTGRPKIDLRHQCYIRRHWQYTTAALVGGYYLRWYQRFSVQWYLHSAQRLSIFHLKMQ